MSLLDKYIDAAYKPRHIEQGSEDWEAIRVGRFTSSEIYKIMTFGWRPMTEDELKARPRKGPGSKTTRLPDHTKMGADGVKYINQKVAEVLTGRPKPQAYAYPLVYGKETEPDAVEHFEKKYGLQCEQIGFQTWGDHAGGSPDRLVGDDELLEVKCPYSSENQIEYMILTDHWDLKANYPEYYWQCVSLLLFTGRKRMHFVTYDPRMIEDRHKMTRLILESERLEEDFDLLNQAIANAVKQKLELLQLLRK